MRRMTTRLNATFPRKSLDCVVRLLTAIYDESNYNCNNNEADIHESISY